MCVNCILDIVNSIIKINGSDGGIWNGPLLLLLLEIVLLIQWLKVFTKIFGVIFGVIEKEFLMVQNFLEISENVKIKISTTKHICPNERRNEKWRKRKMSENVCVPSS